MSRSSVTVLLVAVCLGYLAWDWAYWSRLATIRGQTPLSYPDWIEPTVAVAGDFREPLARGETTLSKTAVERLIDYAEATDSFSLLLYRGQALRLERYWRGLGPDDVTETYSMAKSVLGVMVGHALADGHIASIDDSVADYLPEWRGSDRESITVRHLLEMTSGLAHYRFDFRLLQNPFGKAIRLFVGPDMESAILRFELVEEPGSQFNYNSANSQLLMLVLERAVGRPYGDYVAERLWRPLGAKPARLWLDRPGGMPKGYSFFQARPRDWVRLGVALKNGGTFAGQRVLAPGWLAQMRTPSIRNPKYGLHLWLGSPHVPERFYNRNTPFGVKQAEPFLVDDVFFFDGGGGQRVYVIPSADLVIVRTGMPSPEFDDGVIPNIILRDMARNLVSD